MTQHQWIDLIQAYKKGNTSDFDKNIASIFHQKYRLQLLSLTQSENDAWDVFVDAMLKFREKYLMGDIPLPKNINAFFFQMQRNVWLDLCRKRNAKRKIQYQPLTQIDIAKHLGASVESHNSFFETQEQEQENLFALSKAINNLCDKCKTLLEQHVFNGLKLKTLKTSLGYTGSYQTIVEKKKSCIKKLTKLFFKELNSLD